MLKRDRSVSKTRVQQIRGNITAVEMKLFVLFLSWCFLSFFSSPHNLSQRIGG